ncbi:hypothetical protein ACFRI7_11765 [Streptomyces sp. NPDC056716]|uniref:hypothetical protein n=1 Tax=unclassified Streptomyces TaxID=2593676 RepID=UPI003689C6C8
MPIHIADWYLVRLQFEPVPEQPGLYRLTNPEQDPVRRARQTVHDLRTQGFTVQADYTLDPAPEPAPTRHDRPDHSHRTRLAQAATARPPQLRTAPDPGPAYPATPVPTAATTPSAARGR